MGTNIILERNPAREKESPKTQRADRPEEAKTSTATETTWQATETESAQQATDIPDTQADVEEEEQLLSDDDDNSLLDPFASVEHDTEYSGPKEFTTKDPNLIPCKQHKK